MSDDEIKEWIGRANALAARQAVAALDEPEALMLRLAELDARIRTAPPKLLGSYARLSEADLASATEIRVGELELGNLGWSTVWHEDPLEVLRPVAVEARSADALLRRRRPREIPANPGKAWRAPVKSPVFVVPLRERRQGRVGDNQPYQRRGLIEHRILPCKIGRYTIRLSASSGVGGDGSAERPFVGGAALFQGLKMKTAGTPGKLFTVTECRAPDHPAQIERHMAEAHEGECTGLVWPELTIDSRDRRQVQRALATRLEGPLAHHPPLELAVAGTWHEKKAGRTINRGVVLDGFGRALTAFVKTEAFQTAASGTEDIQEGRTIQVLLLEDRLIGFGICRDFCNVHEGNAFPKLDLDYYIVPSMGNATTAEGHITTARQVRGRYGARSFVVQQSDLDIAEQLGFVVPPTGDLRGLDAAKAHQPGKFKVYPAG